jgi:hypothetical protein
MGHGIPVETNMSTWLNKLESKFVATWFQTHQLRDIIILIKFRDFRNFIILMAYFQSSLQL